MATAKKRINVTLSKTAERAIAQLAKRDQVPEATKAGELLRLALEIEEGQVWDTLANARDKKGARYVSHKKAWE